MTKTEKIKRHFEAGNSLTSWEAIEKFNCTRLAAVVCNLKKQGMKFQTDKLKHTNLEGNTSRFVKYTCVNAEGDKDQISMFTDNPKEFRTWLDTPPKFEAKKHVR